MRSKACDSRTPDFNAGTPRMPSIACSTTWWRLSGIHWRSHRSSRRVFAGCCCPLRGGARGTEQPRSTYSGRSSRTPSSCYQPRGHRKKYNERRRQVLRLCREGSVGEIARGERCSDGTQAGNSFSTLWRSSHCGALRQDRAYWRERSIDSNWPTGAGSPLSRSEHRGCRAHSDCVALRSTSARRFRPS